MIIKNKENSQNFTTKLQEIIFKKSLSIIAGHRITMHKAISYLYSTNKHIDNDITNTRPLTVDSKKMKCLVTNRNNEEEELYNENVKSLYK